MCKKHPSKPHPQPSSTASVRVSPGMGPTQDIRKEPLKPSVGDKCNQNKNALLIVIMLILNFYHFFNSKPRNGDN